jgi:site-specific DNA-methyltransferase (adenine-specific)
VKPYYEQDGIVIYHGDCREILPELPKVDLVLTDPPYGIDWNTDYTRFSCGRLEGPRKSFTKIEGDTDPNLVDILFGDWELICWGAHLFPWKIPTAASWLVWDKRYPNGVAMLADAELAFWSTGRGVYIFSYTWQGMVQGKSGMPTARVHPTQKPVPLMSWCLQKAKATGLILDPFMGSGTTLVAAKQLGRKAIGIEIEEKYCEIAVRRLAQGVLSF